MKKTILVIEDEEDIITHYLLKEDFSVKEAAIGTSTNYGLQGNIHWSGNIVEKNGFKFNEKNEMNVVTFN